MLKSMDQRAEVSIGRCPELDGGGPNSGPLGEVTGVE